MKQVKVKDASVNQTALFTAYTMIDTLREVTQCAQASDFKYGRKYKGYSKSQIRDMVRIARLQLQIFSNELDDTYDWVE